MKPILMAFAALLALAGCQGTDDSSDGYRPMATGPMLSGQAAPASAGSGESYSGSEGYSAAGSSGESYGGPDGPGSGYSAGGPGSGYVDYGARNRAIRNAPTSCPLCELKQFSAGKTLNREFNTNVWPGDWFPE